MGVIDAARPGFEWLDSFAPGYPSHPLRGVRFLEPFDDYTPSFTSAIWLVLLFSFFNIMRYIMFHGPLRFTAKLVNLRTTDVPRYSESVWQMMFYTPAFFAEAYILWGQPYFTELWRMWEPPYPHQLIEPEMHWLYLFQLAWYLHCAFASVFLDEKKADFWALLIHHVVTLLLIGCSLMTGNHRIAAVVMYTHDICDVFLHWCKILRFVDNVKPLSEAFKIVNFATVPISWLYFRLILFPWKAIYPTAVLSITYGGWPNADYVTLFTLGLSILWCLQLYWFYLIMVIVYARLFKGIDLDDVREVENKIETTLQKGKGSTTAGKNGKQP